MDLLLQPMTSLPFLFFTTAGQYCAGDANSVPTGDCSPGWYCTSGAYSNKPTPYVNTSESYSVSECPVYSLNETGGLCEPGKQSEGTKRYTVFLDFTYINHKLDYSKHKR